MPLAFLLDEHISPKVAEQIAIERPDIRIASVRVWRGGTFRGQTDATLLQVAREEGLTLVTYDCKTIPPLLTEWGGAGESHAGVVFVDERTVGQGDIGGQTRALIHHWEQSHTWDWTNLISFLRTPPERL